VAAEPAAEVIIVDCSGSMDWPSTKLTAAKQATAAAIDALRDGVLFAVIAGTPQPPPSSSRTRAAWPARRGDAEGGEAGADPVVRRRRHGDGGVLRLAAKVFDSRASTLRHAILLTDGRNEHEATREAGALLAKVAGQYVCDCRGVGTDWEVGELRRIAETMLGSVDIVAEPPVSRPTSGDDRPSMGKKVADVALRRGPRRGRP